MIVNIERKYDKGTYVIGKLFLGDELFCDTLERNPIPAGTYNAMIAYSEIYKKWLIAILNVPDKELVFITPKENNSNDIQVGLNVVPGKVQYCNSTYMQLHEIVRASVRNGGKVTINIR